MKGRGVLATVCAIFLWMNGAEAAQPAVSIRELRETLPERWVGEYVIRHGDGKNLRDGDTVTIDVPIIVPEVEAVPAVRITWGGPYVGLDASALVEENTENHLVAEFSAAQAEPLCRETAAETYLRTLKANVLEMQERELEAFLLREEIAGEGQRRFRMAFYSTFHGIPYLIGQNFRLEVPGEKAEELLPSVPANVTLGALLEDRIGVNLCVPKEVGVDEDDLPLLEFQEILEIFEQWVRDGYVYSLEELRFGYMAMIDPERKSEEFVLLPVWAAKGITRGSLNMPFYPQEDPESLSFMGFGNPTVCVVNAQTGEKYDFVNDDRENRRYVTELLTWEKIQP